jgi:hypothetical protein
MRLFLPGINSFARANFFRVYSANLCNDGRCLYEQGPPNVILTATSNAASAAVTGLKEPSDCKQFTNAAHLIIRGLGHDM